MVDHRRRTPYLFCGAVLPPVSCQKAEQIIAKTLNEKPPKRRTKNCQNAEQKTAKTPNKKLPKRRTIFRQNAEKLLQMRQTKDII
jgi:hypothetical protein